MNGAFASIERLRLQEFGTHSDLIREQARLRPQHTAVIQEQRRLDYAAFDTLLDRIASALQRDGIREGDAIAICAEASIEYSAMFMGGLRAGAAIAPLAPSSTAESLAAMLADCAAKIVFLDAAVASLLAPFRRPGQRWVMLDGSPASEAFQSWLAPEGHKPRAVNIDPDSAFNIIYSSGTTGTPKGIVQSYRMRWAQMRRDPGYDYGADAKNVALVSTPLYSNTTLVIFLPTFAGGGTVVLLPKFDVRRFLELSQEHRVTHAMLVPVQYRRIITFPDFDRYDLSSYVLKYSTSAPFPADVKRQVLDRWPGGLIEYYGMTEGGASCWLIAHQHPDKLHTVGCPMPGHDMRLIDEEGNEVPRGEIGEVVGRSPAMMNGYYNQPRKTAEAEWYDKEGNRFIRTGDVGRFDDEGFLTLMDRKKDMIISGGFNVYPSDLEAVLTKHEAVLEAAVVGVASERWGETPVAFVTLKNGAAVEAEELLRWANGHLGKAQRISALNIEPVLPRSAIGKVLKRTLRDRYAEGQVM